LALATIAFGAWLFVRVADAVRGGETQSFDERLMLALRTPGHPEDPLGPPWVEEMGRDLTALGGVIVLCLATLGSAGYLFLRRKLKTMFLVLATVGGGQALSYVLKALYRRPRPQLVPHGSYVYTSSFPSGHSMMAAVTYLTLAVLLARVQPRWVARAYLLFTASVLCLLVGVSRVYLGVHYPTDVFAGWAAGASWAALCWLLARSLEEHGRIEPEAKPPPLPAEPPSAAG
jgi:undecaprenyl-diphosphatase